MSARAATAAVVRDVLPDDCQVVRSAAIPLSATEKWRRDRDGSLPKLRIGCRIYYRLADWRRFLNRAQAAGPVPVPWGDRKAAS